MGKILYEKFFDPDSAFPEPDIFDDPTCESSPEEGKKFIEALCKEIEYRELPEKIKQKDQFFSEALVFSEINMIDIQITAVEKGIHATFFIRHDGFLFGFKDLIAMADSFSISANTEYPFVLCLAFDTHGIYTKGRQVYPFTS